jgi:putative sigma-54 modulation protein
MEYKITVRHFELTPGLKQFLERRLKKLDRYRDLILDTEVTLSRDSGFESAEGRLILKHEVLTAQARSQDMYRAVQSLVSKLERQIQRFEERLKGKKRLSQHRP